MTAQGSYGLPKSERVHGRTRVQNLFSGGKGGFVYPFRYIYTVSGGNEAAAAVLVTVPKKLHKRANKRNLLKRRTREAYRLQKQALAENRSRPAASMDIALMYAVKEIVEYKTIRDAVGKIISRIGQDI